MPKPGLGFEYDIGQYVTHERDGNVPPPRYTVVSRLFETGPDGPQRFYCLSPTRQRHSQRPTEHIRAAETQLAPASIPTLERTT